MNSRHTILLWAYSTACHARAVVPGTRWQAEEITTENCPPGASFYFAKIARRRSLVPIRVTRARTQMTAVRP